MPEKRFPRLLIGAASSGSGKTTVACGLLRLLKRRGVRVRAFKCGPDYIDPMFHRSVIGIASRNLDLFFTSPERTRALFARNAADAELSVIEGVMGYYDGLGGTTDEAGSAHLARETETPAVLVVNAKGMSLSLAALLGGFCRFRADSMVRGVILNRISAGSYPMLKAMIERELPELRVLGFLPELPQASLESRHLGLVTADEIGNLSEKLDRVADQMEQTLDLEGLLGLAGAAAPLSFEPIEVEPVRAESAPRIAVARDRAFCFYYEDTFDLLRALGAELISFSPLSDAALPEGTDGIYLGGGYPELYAKELSENKAMLESLRAKVRSGTPCVAECGGFLYLHRTLEGADGREYPMAGLVDARAFRTGKLGRFGYVTLTAKRDTLLCGAGACIRAHEFHYWESEAPGEAFEAKKPAGSRRWDCIHAAGSLFAGFPHLALESNESFARAFVERCAAERR